MADTTYFSSLTNSQFKIPVSDHEIKIQGGKVTTPEWMIDIGGLLNSNVENFEGFAELYGFSSEMGRTTSEKIANQLFTSATLQHSDITVIIPTSDFIPELEGIMNKGNLVYVCIMRLGNIVDLKVPLQELNFSACRIQAMQQQLERTVLSIRVGTRQNTVYHYGQNGTLVGQSVSETSYIQNTFKEG